MVESSAKMSRRCGNVPHSEGNNRFCDRLRRLSSVHWGWLKATTEPTLYSCSLVDYIYPLLRKRRRIRSSANSARPTSFYGTHASSMPVHQILPRGMNSLKILIDLSKSTIGAEGQEELEYRVVYYSGR